MLFQNHNLEIFLHLNSKLSFIFFAISAWSSQAPTFCHYPYLFENFPRELQWAGAIFMAIDFMVKIIVFDCYLTKVRLLYVLKTRAVAAGVVFLGKYKVRSCQTAPVPLWCHSALWEPLCAAAFQRAHRASVTFPMSPHASWQSMGQVTSVFPPSRCPHHWHTFSYLGNARPCL